MIDLTIHKMEGIKTSIIQTFLHQWLIVYELYMNQQRQVFSSLEQLIYKLEFQLLPKNNKGNNSTNIGKQLEQVIKDIQNYFTETQCEKVKYVEELNQLKKKIKMYEISLKQMNQELERLKLLLPIKQQLINSCKKEISVLQNTIKQSMQTITRKGQKIDEFAVSRVFQEVQLLSFKEQQTKDNSYYSVGFIQTKPKILLKKNLDDTHKKDLDMAKLKNYTCKLNLQNRTLKAELQLMKIQNSHLKVQLQSFIQEMQFSNQLIAKFSNKALKNDLSTKCQKLESYIDKLTTKLQKIQINQNTQNWNHRIDIPLHPPTPYFSGGNFGFGQKQKNFDFDQVLQINQSIISMGESISEGLQ